MKQSTQIQIGLAVLGVLFVSYLAKRTADAAGKVAGQVYDTAEAAVEAVNPWNQENVIYQTANAAGGALVTDPQGPGKNADGSWSLGGWLYDVTHPETYNAIRNISKP